MSLLGVHTLPKFQTLAKLITGISGIIGIIGISGIIGINLIF